MIKIPGYYKDIDTSKSRAALVNAKNKEAEDYLKTRHTKPWFLKDHFGWPIELCSWKKRWFSNILRILFLNIKKLGIVKDK